MFTSDVWVKINIDNSCQPEHYTFEHTHPNNKGVVGLNQNVTIPIV